MKNIMAISIIFCTLFVSSIAFAIEYEIIDLGFWGGSNAWDINNNSQIVGMMHVGGQQHAMLYENGVALDLGLPSGTNQSWATGINDSGQIMVEAYNSSSRVHVFMYENENWTDIGLLPGMDESRATYSPSLNENGQIVGESRIQSGSDYRAFSYYAGVITDIGTNGYDGNIANAINNNGQIVGTYVGGNDSAFLYDNGSWTDLSIALANDINDNGQIAGYHAGHAALYENGLITDLGVLGGSSSWAYDINNNGQIVGGSEYDASGYFHAFLYDNGNIVDLGTLGGTYSNALAINDLGQIVGYAGTSTGEQHAVIWNPVGTPFPIIPEPINSVLFIAGGSLLAFRRFIIKSGHNNSR